MADAATARREARRRKILENSHNRLQLISGKNVDEACNLSLIKAPIAAPIQEVAVIQENSSFDKCTINNGVISSGDSYALNTINYENFAIGDGDVNGLSHDSAAFVAPATSEPTQTQPIIDKLVNNKYDIVLLSLLIQFLYSLSITNFSDSYFFVPLVIYVASKQLWFPKQHSSNFANVLLLLNGMSANRIQRIVSITQWVSAFSQDLCVFLFTTICLQSILHFISSSVM